MLLFWRRFTKFLFLFLSFIILVCGGVVSAVGFIIRFRTELLAGHVTPLLEILPSGGGTGQNVDTLYAGVAAAIIAFGGVMFIIGLIGCAVGTCPNKGVLIAYGVVTIILLLLQITSFCLLATMKVDDKLEETLLSNFVNYYKGYEATDDYSVAWNYIMVEFDCCAVDGYKDFVFCYWDRQKTVDNETFTVVLSETCCKVPGQYPNYGQPIDDNCTMGPTDENSYMNNGCVDEVEDYLWRYKLVMMLTLGVAIAIEIATSAAGLVLQYAKKQARGVCPDETYQQNDVAHETLKKQPLAKRQS